MSDWIIEMIESVGYPALGFLMFLENVFPPIPSELIMPFAGFSSARGHLSLSIAVLVGTLGSVVGQLPLYYIGRRMGEERIRSWIERHGKWLLLRNSDMDKANRLFEKHGGATVFLCRLLPGVRSFISIPAGIEGMNLCRFLLYSTLGMGLWAFGLSLAGYYLETQYELIQGYLEPFAYAVFALLAAALLYRIARSN